MEEPQSYETKDETSASSVDNEIDINAEDDNNLQDETEIKQQIEPLESTSESNHHDQDILNSLKTKLDLNGGGEHSSEETNGHQNHDTESTNHHQNGNGHTDKEEEDASRSNTNDEPNNNEYVTYTSLGGMDEPQQEAIVDEVNKRDVRIDPIDLGVVQIKTDRKSVV